MTHHTASYARYSTDMQSEASIEDQHRLNVERIKLNGWTLHKSYEDAATSGASLFREGIQSLIEDAYNGEFNIIVCESLDRLSRDQADISTLYRQMTLPVSKSTL